MVEQAIISIVDDDDLLRDAIQRLLRSHGYAVHGFASAEDFLKSSLPDKSSCIISDVQLPAMDGVAMQSQLRAKGNKVPIILITAYPNAAMEARARIAGAICVLHKPFDSDALVQWINTALKSMGSGKV